MPNFLIAWNDTGDLVRTKDIRPAFPQWTRINGTMLGNVNDACFDWQSPYIQNTGNRHLGVYCVTTTGSTLRIYYCADTLAAVPSWTLQKSYTMTDTTVETSARIVASPSEAGFVIAAWRTQAGTYVARTSDGGDTWSSTPIFVGEAVSDANNDDAPIGLTVEGDAQLISAIHDVEDYRLFAASSASGTFDEVTNSLFSEKPFPFLAIADTGDACATIILGEEGFYQNDAGTETGITGVTVSATGSPVVCDVPSAPPCGTAAVASAHGTASESNPLTLRVEFNLGESYTVAGVASIGASPTVLNSMLHSEDSDNACYIRTKVELRTLENDLLHQYQNEEVIIGSGEFPPECSDYLEGYAIAPSSLYPVDNVGIVVCEITALVSGEIYLPTIKLTFKENPILYRVNDYTASSSWNKITPVPYAAPTQPSSLSIDPENNSQVAVLGKNFNGQTRLFTSNNQGQSWSDRGINEYTSVKRRGQTILFGGTDTLDISLDSGTTKYDLLGDWPDEIGAVGTIRGFLDLVEELDSGDESGPARATDARFCGLPYLL